MCGSPGRRSRRQRNIPGATIIVEEYRDIEYGGIERHSESYIHHQHGADPRRLIGENIALFMNDGILPVVHSR